MFSVIWTRPLLDASDIKRITPWFQGGIRSQFIQDQNLAGSCWGLFPLVKNGIGELEPEELLALAVVDFAKTEVHIGTSPALNGQKIETANDLLEDIKEHLLAGRDYTAHIY